MRKPTRYTYKSTTRTLTYAYGGIPSVILLEICIYTLRNLCVDSRSACHFIKLNKYRFILDKLNKGF